MKTYTGQRHQTGPSQVWVLDGQGGRLLDPAPSQRLANHSPTGFEWGYLGSGPAQLALALLLEHTGDKALALDLHQQFKSEVVAAWTDESWSLTASRIDAWLELHTARRPRMSANEHAAFPKGRW